MDNLNLSELKENQVVRMICFPNTVADIDKSYYTIWTNCDTIQVQKYNWDWASVLWFQIISNNNVIAEIKQSVCDVYYKF